MSNHKCKPFDKFEKVNCFLTKKPYTWPPRLGGTINLRSKRAKFLELRSVFQLHTKNTYTKNLTYLSQIGSNTSIEQPTEQRDSDTIGLDSQ